MKSVVFLTTLSLSVSAFAVEYIYRWVDDSAQIHYTQTAPRDRPYETLRADTAVRTNNGALATDETGGNATPTPASNAAQSPEDANRAFLKKAQAEEKAAADAKAKQAGDRAAHDARCKQARQLVAALDSSIPQRTATIDDSGEVSRMTEEQYAERRTEAEKAIAESCR